MSILDTLNLYIFIFVFREVIMYCIFEQMLTLCVKVSVMKIINNFM